jgi:hypothetical protein
MMNHNERPLLLPAPADTTNKVDGDEGGGRTRLWQEEVIIQRFGLDYDQPKLEDLLSPDDDTRHLMQPLPVRYLDQWYLFRRRDAPYAANPYKQYEGIWAPRTSLPEETWLADDDYILRGWLRPAPPDAYYYPAPAPILVQIDRLDLWCVNLSKKYRGYWFLTQKAMYWLRDPSMKQGNVHVRIKGSKNYNIDANLSCPAVLPRPSSQEDLHWLPRARMGLIANIVDLFPETEVDEEELYYPTLTPEQLHAELKNGDDEPFDLELLRSEALFVYPHIRGVIETEPYILQAANADVGTNYEKDDEKDSDKEEDQVECAFLTSLKALTSTRVFSITDYQESAIRAEQRSINTFCCSANDQEVATFFSERGPPFVLDLPSFTDDNNDDNKKKAQQGVNVEPAKSRQGTKIKCPWCKIFRCFHETFGLKQSDGYFLYNQKPTSEMRNLTVFKEMRGHCLNRHVLDQDDNKMPPLLRLKGKKKDENMCKSWLPVTFLHDMA